MTDASTLRKRSKACRLNEALAAAERQADLGHTAYTCEMDISKDEAKELGKALEARGFTVTVNNTSIKVEWR